MRFTAAAETDIGILKKTNEDSVLVKHAATDCGEVLLAAICDGMGGLAKGELASATAVRAFSKWFDEELPYELENMDMQIIGSKWSLMLKELNLQMLEYGTRIKKRMGTTFSGILLFGGRYVIVHVGDTRIYHIGDSLSQLTADHTFVAREVRRGTMTVAEAETDDRQNLLLQCIGGASNAIEPQILYGRAEKGAYMLCSDGFRHTVTEAEMCRHFAPAVLTGKDAMRSSARRLIGLAKERRERDNISVVLVKVY